MRRLFMASVTVERREADGVIGGTLWTASPDLQEEPVGSVLTLSNFFMTEIEGHAVPINGQAFMDLSGSPLAMDLYCWLTWRFSFLRVEQTLDWGQLQQQFGANVQSSKKLRESVAEALSRVRAVYPEVRALPTASGLRLIPSPTSVRKRRR